MRGEGQPSLPRHSEDGSEIRWRGICGTSKDRHEQSECDLEKGHEQSWSPDFWRSHRRTNRKAWLKRYSQRRACWKKIGWMPTVVRTSDWNLVMAIKLQWSKEERVSAKEWAQIDNLLRICSAARSSSHWEAVVWPACRWDTATATAWRSEAGGPVGQAGEGI